MDPFEELIEKNRSNTLKLDIHFHSAYSGCSNLSIDNVRKYLIEHKIELFTVTDHHTTLGCKMLEESCPEVKIIWAVEITAKEGDFLVYSLDKDYLSHLTNFQDSVDCLERNDHTAIIWAHPRVPTRESIGWTSPGPESKRVLETIRHIDGIEIFNGKMLELTMHSFVQRVYFTNLVKIAYKGNDDGKLSLTGASDAHDFAHFFTAWTAFSKDIKTPEDFIFALKNREVLPGFNRDFYKIRVP